MTTAVAKTPVEAKWNIKKVQDEAARVVASNCLAAQQVLSKYGDKALEEYKAATRQFRVNHLKSLGVKTPIEIAKAIAEAEANIFGSKIDIHGDEKSATLTYNQCGMWNAIKEVGKLTREQEEKMGEGFQTCMQDLAKELGVKANVQMGEESCTVTFTK